MYANLWTDRKTLSESFNVIHNRIHEAAKIIDALPFSKDLSRHPSYRELFHFVENSPWLRELSRSVRLYEARATDPDKAEQLSLELRGLYHTISEVADRAQTHFEEHAQRMQLHTVVRDLRELTLQLEKTIPRSTLEDSRTSQEERAALFFAKKPEETTKMDVEELKGHFTSLKGMVTSSRYFYTETQRKPFTTLLQTLEKNLDMLENPDKLLNKLMFAKPGIMPVEQAKVLLADELPQLINKAFEQKKGRVLKTSVLDSKLDKREAASLRKIAKLDLSETDLVKQAESALSLLKKGFEGKEMPKDIQSKLAKVGKRVELINAADNEEAQYSLRNAREHKQLLKILS